MKDGEILKWLEDNMYYMEHGERNTSDGYWPQTEDDYDIDPESPYIGMSLREYIETRAKEQK